MSFSKKFVKYLTEGMPIHIPEDEVFLFYNALKEFFNTANNAFVAFYEDGDEALIISDDDKDYLKVIYSDDNISFRHATPDSILDSPAEIIIAGQAFLGVIIFIERLSPSEDTELILRSQNDRWKL